MRPLPIVIALAMLLGGCSPAVYLKSYNATDDTFTIARAQFRPIITVPPHSAADLPLGYQAGEHVVIHSSRHIWTYSPGLLFAAIDDQTHHGHAGVCENRPWRRDFNDSSSGRFAAARLSGEAAKGNHALRPTPSRLVSSRSMIKIPREIAMRALATTRLSFVSVRHTSTALAVVTRRGLQ